MTLSGCLNFPKIKLLNEVFDNVRQFIAGPSSEDANVQLKNEIRHLAS